MTCPVCAAEAPVGARFCSACGTALVLPTSGAGRPQLEASPPLTGERRQVTILFADFSGFTAFAAHLDPEDLHDRMKSLWTGLDAIIGARGGTPEKHSGDAIMAVFGGWRSREEDPAAAVRAALEMQTWLAAQQVETRGGSLQLRIGVHTGLVVVGPSAHAGEFLATGDAVNLASRLEQSAPVGGVLISGDTYRHVYGFFDAQARPLLTVKGKSEPVETYLILRAKPRALALQMRGVEGVETDMIGRERELKCLQDVFRQAMEQRAPQLITLVGDGGMGKSRLLREFQKWIDLLPQNVRFFCGRATAEIATLPFALVRDVLATRFEIHESDLAVVSREKLVRGVTDLLGPLGEAGDWSREELTRDIHFLGQLLGWDFSASPHLREILRDVEQIRHRALRGLNRLVTAISRCPAVPPALPVSAILVVVEDLHWADDGSLDLLEHLANHAGGVPLLILGSARPDLFERRPGWGQGRANLVQLLLEPLNLAESAALVENILNKAPEIPPALRELVTDGADGNPFYIEEMINMLIDQRVIQPGAERWQIELGRLVHSRVPSTLTGVLQARLDGLAAPERIVLQRASVVGRVFWDSAIEFMSAERDQAAAVSLFGENLLNRPELERALLGLRQKELLFRRESSVFAGTVEYSFKHELLRNVAYESLLKKTRRRHHARIAEWLMARSGDRTQEFAGLVATHFEHATQPGEAAEWHGRAGQQARLGYGPAIASDHFAKALRLLPLDDPPTQEDQVRRLAWQEGLGETLAAQARFAEALASYTAMRDLAVRLVDPLAEARAWNGMAFLHERHGDNRASIHCAERAEAVAAHAGATGSSERVRAMHIKGWAYYRLGDAPAVLALGEQTLRLCSETGDRRGTATSFKLLGVAHLQLGRYLESDRFFAQGLTLYQELDDRRNAAAMWSNRGECARACGDHQTAADLYVKALAIARDIGHRESELIYLANLGAVRVGLGAYAEAERDLRQVISETTSPNSCTLAEAFSLLSEACLGQDKLPEAAESARRAITLAKESENALFLGGAWRSLGRVVARTMDAKLQSLDPGILGADAPMNPRSCFAESLRVFEEIKAEGEQARTLRAWGEYEFATGVIASAHEKIAQARNIFLRLGARFEVANAEALLRGFGGR